MTTVAPSSNLAVIRYCRSAAATVPRIWIDSEDGCERRGPRRASSDHERLGRPNGDGTAFWVRPIRTIGSTEDCCADGNSRSRMPRRN